MQSSITEQNTTSQHKMMKFTINENMITHLIKSQAGTIPKAITELIMNSIDSNSTRIDIEISSTNFSIRDNGIGFSSTQEIIKNFGDFGKPHEDGDSRFGKFRMGRGQIINFASVTWKSKNFSMSVDIKNMGMGYVLNENETEHIDGYLIKCFLIAKAQATALARARK